MNPDEALFQAIVDGLTERENRVHAETAVAAAAALAGEAVLRESGVDLAAARPGQVIFSDRVNQLLFGDTEDPRGWPEDSVWGLFRDLLPQVGLAADLGAPVGELARNAAAHVYDGGPWPYLSVPAEHWPQIESLRLAVLFRTRFRQLAKSQGLDSSLATGCATLACVRFISAAEEVLPPPVAVRLALEVTIGTAKTCPLARMDQRVDPAAFGREVLRFEDGV